MATSLIIKGPSRNGTFLTDSTHCINTEFLSSGNSDVGCNIEAALSKLTAKFKISVDKILFGPSAEIHFSVEFQVVSNAYFQIGSLASVANGIAHALQTI
jgi:hypothetical protein